jgi:hypothetical protein
MTKVELIALAEAVRADLIRYNDDPNEPIALACLFAVWHLKGEPSFVERHDRLKQKAKDHLVDAFPQKADKP